MMDFRRFLKIRPGEDRMVALLTGLMLSVSIGAAIGTPGVDALFFTRFGVVFLPYMYMALGALTVIIFLSVTGLLGKISKVRLYLGLPLLLSIILLVSRLILFFGFRWFYPILWLVASMAWSLQGLFTWGIAGGICDTRQAKRLFPLFGAGSILGISLGGMLTRPLVQLVGAENLLMIWSLGLFVAFLLGIVLVRTVEAPGAREIGLLARREEPGSALDQIRQGYESVRNASLLRWLALASILFAVLYFSLSFTFSAAATASFPDTDQLSAFLGVFQGLSTGAAFLASLFLANKLYARFGVTNMVLSYTMIYLLGFGFMAVYPGFGVLAVFRFMQVLWYQGVASAAYQAVYNVVPPGRRDQTRAFSDGVLAQMGIILAGGLLLVSEQLLDPNQLFVLAAGLALVATAFVWRASHAYRDALVAALKAGQPQLFNTDQEPFGGFQRDAAAVATLVEGVHHPDPVVRRVSAEILGNLSVPEASDVLVSALEDEDSQVRVALLRSLAKAKATAALLEILMCLKDPEPEVRKQAVDALRELAGYARGVVVQVEPLLHDPDPAVRASAGVTLLKFGPHPEAWRTLEEMVKAEDTSSRLESQHALAGWWNPQAYDLAITGLQDENSAVRRAASIALVNVDKDRCVAPLVSALADEDASVREAVATALGHIGPLALPETLAALEDSNRENGALLALERLPVREAQEPIREFYTSRIAQALTYSKYSRNAELLPPDSRVELLQDSLDRQAHREGVNALRALGLLKNHKAIQAAVENLESRDPNQAANALEILETIDDANLVKPLLVLWEPSQNDPIPDGDRWLEELMEDSNPWLRACAVLVAGPLDDPRITARLQTLAETDSDRDVREAAASQLKGNKSMETLQTLSLMERILFLRHVPLFAALAPSDLKRIASVAQESLFSGGETIVRQGESGEEMYIIVSGEVAVMVEDEHGHQIEVARRQSGEYVGEMAIISDEPRMATLVAVGDVRTLYIGQKPFENLLRERPEASLALMRVLCNRLREQIARIEEYV